MNYSSPIRGAPLPGDREYDQDNIRGPDFVNFKRLGSGDQGQRQSRSTDDTPLHIQSCLGMELMEIGASTFSKAA
ncbi:MAG: hypothetical protein JWO15_366 [Sphingomonadales bacterium]|nr:hypothetical protein [Sphingomonadales bacterium]